MKPHRGTLILVLGILSLIICNLIGIPAWLMANRDLKEMDAGTMDPAGRGSTQAGRICGMIGTIFFVVVFVVAILAALILPALAVHARHTAQ